MIDTHRSEGLCYFSLLTLKSARRPKGGVHMKKYEIMYILKANLEDAARNELIGKLHEILSLDGSTVDDVNEWGLKDLAYEIKKERKGYYVVVKVSASSSKVINEFDRLAKINPNVLRHLIIAL